MAKTKTEKGLPSPPVSGASRRPRNKANKALETAIEALGEVVGVAVATEEEADNLDPVIRFLTTEADEEEIMPSLPVPVVVGMVPLDEQLTETETALGWTSVEGGARDSWGDAAVAENPVPHPWDSWPEPEFLTTRMNHLGASVDDDGEMIFTQNNAAGSSPLGKTTRRSLENLAWHVFYPTEFVEKLSPPTAAAVVNERIAACRDRELVLAKEGVHIVNLAFKHHEMIPMREVAQTAYDTMDLFFPSPSLLFHEQRTGGMVLRLGSDRLQKDVTTRKGDILQFGIEVRYGYGERMKVSLYTTRLVCLNGMVADQAEWGWEKKTEGTVAHQKEWLRARVEEMVPRFEATVEMARRMALSGLPEGTIKELAEQFARQHSIQTRNVPMVVDAWNRMVEEEPFVERTEWDLLNAFTRAGTHDERISAEQRESLLVRTGAAMRDNEIVLARLRRATAERVRAEIIPE